MKLGPPKEPEKHSNLISLPNDGSQLLVLKGEHDMDQHSIMALDLTIMCVMIVLI